MNVYAYEIWFKNGGYTKNYGDEISVRWVESQFSVSLIERFKVWLTDLTELPPF